MNQLSFTCPRCRAQSLRIKENRAGCISCGYQAEGKKAAVELVEKNLEGKNSSAKKLKIPVYECPECTEEALVDLGAAGECCDGPHFICFACGCSWQKEELERCPECNQLKPGSGFEELIICRSAVGFYVCGDCYLKIFRHP